MASPQIPYKLTAARWIELLSERYSPASEEVIMIQYPIEKAKEAFETASDVNESVKVLFTPGGLL